MLAPFPRSGPAAHLKGTELPLTPFHFGPGLFVKSVAPRHFSFAAFVATQIIIDCETLYYLLQPTYPVHRTLHTLAGAAAAGLATSAALITGRRIVGRVAPAATLRAYKPSLRAETSTAAILIGGVIGGSSHSFLDAIVHHDVRPFAPWSNANPFLHLIGGETLQIMCVLLGLIGIVLLGTRLSKEPDEVASPVTPYR